MLTMHAHSATVTLTVLLLGSSTDWGGQQHRLGCVDRVNAVQQV